MLDVKKDHKGGIVMNKNAAKLLMAMVILTRSSAFIFSKFAMEELSPFQALGFRFTLACLLMGAVLYRHIAQALSEDSALARKSCLLGFLLFCIMGCEMESLRTAEVHTVAFLENLSLALVPLFLALWYRRLPSFPDSGCKSVMEEHPFPDFWMSGNWNRGCEEMETHFFTAPVLSLEINVRRRWPFLCAAAAGSERPPKRRSP